MTIATRSYADRIRMVGPQLGNKSDQK